ncbi:MBL fold metallo-hydrolase RNA specificity domain-containing protein [Novosphingobium sp. JCM 18896]|uniref:MBL fold metallo-hydrolase RNA specificity domain-containing protein n=1 Tax=Novosphingobium sp. JCM 18896 TaxID=2989731 RepID=UPI002223090D|nr:MBL fold metallo-hydrolase [Novosphingobium sp. JCM 18896]MCW1431944.1 MBL fold metallo-hydrolase [Novosphingobium sp. JCM 18896]
MHKRKKKHRQQHNPGIAFQEPNASLHLETRPEGAGLAIAFLGASGTVTGSRYLVDDGETRVVVDSGLFQGAKDLRVLNWAPIPPDVADVGLVLLTHAHLDHSGALPRMARLGWNGTVLCTRATTALCELLLPDSGHLQEKDADFANRHGFSRHQPAQPLYTQADARLALELFQTIRFGEWHPIADGISARYHDAGHILGAASIELSWKGRTILFSGDIGRYGDAVMKDPVPPARADYVLVESTYGDRRHEKVDPTTTLGDHIERCVRRGGTVVIPAFAVGRVQSLLYHLSRLRAAGRLRDTPIYLDSPMAINASELMCKFMDEHRLNRTDCEAACGVAHYVREVEESKALTADTNPKVIISASGMATGGRVLHHLKRFAPDPKNLVLFAGFQAAGTRGAALVAGAKTIKIHGEYVPVEAEVANLTMLSAHADSDEIIRWLGSLEQAPRQVFVTHGEPTGSNVLAKRVSEELGWSCTVPTLGSWSVLA